MKSKKSNELIFIYWIIQSLCYFFVSGFGFIPQFFGLIVLVVSLIYLITRKEFERLLCIVFYSIVTILMIVLLFIINCFFGFQKILILLVICCLINVLTIFKLIQYVKNSGKEFK